MLLRRLICLLSLLLVFTPVTSPYAMATQGHPSCHDSAMMAGHPDHQTGCHCASHDGNDNGACQDADCQCDACASAMTLPDTVRTQSRVQPAVASRDARDHADIAVPVIVPPPIVLL